MSTYVIYYMRDLDRLLSPALREANLLLLERRKQQSQKERKTDAEPAVSSSRPSATIADLPAHLGWGSTAATAVLRRAHTLQNRCAITPTAVPEPIYVATAVSTAIPLPSTVKLYPDIGLGILRQEQAASGRIWLLARHLDTSGSGKFRIAALREAITKRSAPLHICGWRHLRNLFRQGDGVFWHRDKTHLWLHSAVKTASALGVSRLNGRPVHLPISALTGSISDVRAHLYAAFHSGRVKAGGGNGAAPKPIARETLTKLAGIGAVTQRSYEQKTKISVRHNYAIGERANEEIREARAWKHGGAAFIVKDTHGQHGRKGEEYIAWQLPNSYGSTHQQRPLGRQKRINRQLKDLVMKGMPGNVDQTSGPQMPKLYYANGKAATTDSYWFRKSGGNGRYALWHTVTA